MRSPPPQRVRPRPPLAVLALAGLLGGLLPGAQVARAGDFEAFQHARQAYEAGDYDAAVRRFEALVGGPVPRLEDPGLLVESRKLLGAAYLFLGKREAAERQFELILREEPDYPLDPVQFPEEVRRLFEQVRKKVREQLRAEAEARRRAERQRAERLERARRAELARWQRLQALAATERVEVRRSPWPLWMPFGVGQFHNGQAGLGWLLLGGEGLLAVASVTSWALHQSLRSAAQRNPQADAFADGLRITNWVTTGLLALLAAAGIVQAHLAYEPVRRLRRRRPLPEPLRDPPDLSKLCGDEGAPEPAADP